MRGLPRGGTLAIGAILGALVFSAEATESATAQDSVAFSDVAVSTVVSPLRPEGFTEAAISKNGTMAVFAGTFDQSLITLNLASGQSNKLESIGTYPWDVSLSPDGRTAYVLAIENNELLGFDTTTLDLRSRITFADYAGSASLTVSPDGSRAYVVLTRAFNPPVPATNQLVVLDLNSGTVVRSIPLSSVLTTSGLRRAGTHVVAPGGTSWIYVADHLAKAIQVVDPTAGTVTRSLPFDGELSSIAVSQDGSRILVMSKGRDSVTLLDGLSGAQLWESSTYPGSPGGAVIDDVNGFAYVTLEYTGTVMRFDLQTGATERRTFANMQLGDPALVDNGKTVAIPITPTSLLLMQPSLSQKQTSVRLPAPDRVRAQWKNGSVNVFWRPFLGDKLPPAESFTVTTQPRTITCKTATNSCIFTNLKRGQSYRFTVTAHLGDESSKATRSRSFAVPR